MSKKQKVHSVSLEAVYDLIQGKTPCCQLENGQIKCSATFSNHRYCYDVFIKDHQQNFSLVFMDSEEVKSSADILVEAGVFFEELKISEKNIIQKADCVHVKIPAQKILSVIENLNIYCPDDDETILLPDDFSGLSQKQIDKKCLELDDLDEFDEEYNIV